MAGATEPATAAPCELLEWDSAHFGFPIARVVSGKLTASSAEAIDEWCAARGIHCLYLLADADDSETARVAATHGFRVVDVRVTVRCPYERLVKQGGGPSWGAVTVREATADDLPYARDLAARSHRSSRFYFDGGFREDRCDALYSAWIDRGFRDPERRLLIGIVDDERVGYIVLAPLGLGGEGNGELVAVDERHRGKGFGRALHHAAYRDFASRGGHTHLGAMSFRNVLNLQLHERLGFLTDKLEVWHHKWFDR